MCVFRQLSDLAVLLHHRCQHDNLSVSTNTAIFNDSQVKAAMSVLTRLRVKGAAWKSGGDTIAISQPVIVVQTVSTDVETC